MIDLINILLLIAAVIVGGVIVSIMDGLKQKKMIKIMLSFSGGFLLSIAFVHFLPELYESHTPYSIGSFILIGFLIQLFLEYFSGGIEHGHIHIHKNNRVPWSLFISLSIHSFIDSSNACCNSFNDVIKRVRIINKKVLANFNSIWNYDTNRIAFR